MAGETAVMLFEEVDSTALRDEAEAEAASITILLTRRND